MDQDEIDNSLAQLNNKSAKLLYLINYIYEKGQIDQQQKLKLKYSVLLEKEEIFNLLLNANDIKKFIESAKSLLVSADIIKDQTKSTVHKALISSMLQNQINQCNECEGENVDEMMSPQGNFLLRAKRINKKKNK